MFDKLAKLFIKCDQKTSEDLEKYVEFWKYMLNTFPSKVIKKLQEKRFVIETTNTGSSFNFTYMNILWWEEKIKLDIICLKTY